MLSDKLGHIFDKPLKNLAKKIPFSPNFISVTGFLITFLAAFVLIYDLRIGGLLILLGAVFDMIDGLVARSQNRESLFGAFLDSLLDRYSDALIMIGLALHFEAHAVRQGVLLSVGTLIGSLLVSYARARAEGIGKKCTHGLMERTERIMLIVLGTVTGTILPVLWISFILTHATVVQRVVYIWRATRESSEP